MTLESSYSNIVYDVIPTLFRYGNLMILTVGGIKGGSGKTTVATNLACIAATQNADILLVDADDQETASDFTAVRKEDYPDAPRYTCTKLTGKSCRN